MVSSLLPPCPLPPLTLFFLLLPLFSFLVVSVVVEVCSISALVCGCAVFAKTKDEKMTNLVTVAGVTPYGWREGGAEVNPCGLGGGMSLHSPPIRIHPFTPTRSVISPPPNMIRQSALFGWFFSIVHRHKLAFLPLASFLFPCQCPLAMPLLLLLCCCWFSVVSCVCCIHYPPCGRYACLLVLEHLVFHHEEG